MIVSIYEVEKLITLQIRHLEHHFLFVGEVVAFEFSAKVPGELVGIYRSQSDGFGFRANSFVKMPIGVTWTISKLNVVVWMIGEERTKLP